jgi:hypothetical protein
MKEKYETNKEETKKEKVIKDESNAEERTNHMIINECKRSKTGIR